MARNTRSHPLSNLTGRTRHQSHARGHTARVHAPRALKSTAYLSPPMSGRAKPFPATGEGHSARGRARRRRIPPRSRLPLLQALHAALRPGVWGSHPAKRVSSARRQGAAAGRFRVSWGPLFRHARRCRARATATRLVVHSPRQRPAARRARSQASWSLCNTRAHRLHASAPRPRARRHLCQATPRCCGRAAAARLSLQCRHATTTPSPRSPPAGTRSQGVSCSDTRGTRSGPQRQW
jgi:hypothetical protein